jgi:hypothetical protein
MEVFRSGIFGAKEAVVPDKAGTLHLETLQLHAQAGPPRMAVLFTVYTTPIERLSGTTFILLLFPPTLQGVVKLLAESEMFQLLQFRSCPKATSIYFSLHPKPRHLSNYGISDPYTRRRTATSRRWLSPKPGNPKAITSGATSELIL